MFVGADKPQTRVTVDPNWFLNMTHETYSGSKRGPFRWWQLADNSQIELEINNVLTVAIDRSIDTDVGSCKISIKNQWMDLNGVDPAIPGQLGNPGYFSFGHGVSEEAKGRWNQVTNDWKNILIPNALLRTYQGYGGYDADTGLPMEIEDAVAGGYLTITGVWLIDSIEISSNGSISISARDVGKLLAVQQVFPPLVPSKEYLPGLQFCRWKTEEFDAKFNPRMPTMTGTVHDVAPHYRWSSADSWYGYNADIHGHRGTDSVDGREDTFALSVGNSHPSRPFCTDYFEYDVNDTLNEVYVKPWCGNYTMYISVMENGVWQDGGGTIPYDYHDLCSSQTCVDTGADIPFVMRVGVPWETGAWYALPRPFKAARVRISFRDHTQSPWGPWFYRCGIRELKLRVNTLVSSPPKDPWVFAMETYRNPDSVVESGYWCAADDGQVFAFGDARVHEPTTLFYGGHQGTCMAIRGTPSGQGYFLLQDNGRVLSYGDGVWNGDWIDESGSPDVFGDFVDMAVTPSGAGYWLLRRNGTVHAYGDATHHGDMPITAELLAHETANGTPYNVNTYGGMGIESHPTDDGYWIVNGGGQVRAFGAVSSLGEVTPPYGDKMVNHEWVRGIRRNTAGDGYWLMSSIGNIWAFGAATFYGQPGVNTTANPMQTLYDAYRHLSWQIAPASQDDGYLIVRADGEVVAFTNGFDNQIFFGRPGGVGWIRTDGNYKDYADIVKLLLAWSGWILYDGETPDYVLQSNFVTHDTAGFSRIRDNESIPPVFGNIENTGAFADDCLGVDVFDKKPPLDGINTLKEIVGYIFWIDDEGAAHFETPNWWSIGNFWEDGSPVDFLPEVDERTVLTDYNITFSDDSARSEIIIANEDPTKGNTDTINTRLIPKTASLLRGMVKPAMWTNGVFNNPKEQAIMAELIALHIWFQQRVGNVTMSANPCIQINDQVRIYERTTAETYVHYVRGISSNHDLTTGQYTMTLTTHWLGDETNWAITRDAVKPGKLALPPGEDLPTSILQYRAQVSDDLQDWMGRIKDNPKVAAARLNDWNSTPVTTISTGGTPIESGDTSDGSANG